MTLLLIFECCIRVCTEPTHKVRDCRRHVTIMVHQLRNIGLPGHQGRDHRMQVSTWPTQQALTVVAVSTR